jgi:DNA uptake protein ComE-like DNA-binding protein
MKKKHRALSILLALALATLPGIAYAQTQGDQAKSSMQSAGTATKDAAKSVGSATASGTKAASDKVTGKIDINSANKADLMKLDGVGDAISAKIIAGRPYHTKRDLLTRKIVNLPTYNKISDKIVAHASNSSTTAKK